MNRSIAGIFSGIALIFVLAAPLPSYAASATFFGPIVPAECHCDNQAVQGGSGTVTSAPDYGCVLQVIQNLINIGISLSIIIFTIFLVLTGFAFITSAGSSQARSKAKTRFTNLFVGLLVLLSAWLIVDFVMKTLYNEEGQFGPWNAILAGQADKSDHCITAKEPTAITAGSVGTSITTAPPGTTAAGGSGAATGATGGNTGMNIDGATRYIVQHAASGSTNKCAGYVCNAINNGGGLKMGCANAFQMGTPLKSAGFVAVYSGTYSPSSQYAFPYQAGDVVVFQPVPGHKWGHTAMFTGSQWVSDFVQKSMDPTSNGAYTGGSFTVYRP